MSNRRRMLEAASAMRAVTENNAAAYARVGAALYRSLDEGQTWSVRDSGITTAGGLCICRNDGAALATGNVSAYMWEFPMAGGYDTKPCNGVAVNVASSDGGGYVYYCTNAGSSWQTGYSTTIWRKQGLAGTPVAMKTFSTWDQANEDIVCSQDGRYVLIGGKAGFTNCFYSTNYGETWGETAATQSAGAGCNGVDMSNDGQVCMVGMSDGLWLSTSGPQNLTRLSSANIMSCAVSGDGNTMYYVTNHTLYRSFNRGTHWTSLGDCGNPLKMQTSYLGEKILTYDGSGIYAKDYWGESGWSGRMYTGGVSDVCMNKWRSF